MSQMEVNFFSESAESEDEVHHLHQFQDMVAREEAGEEVAEEDTGTGEETGARRKRRKICPLHKELLQLSLSLLNNLY